MKRKENTTVNRYGAMARSHWARWLPQQILLAPEPGTSEDPEETNLPPADTGRPLIIDRSHPLWAEVNAEQQELAQDS